MKSYFFPEARHVIVSGDIHGDFKSVVYKLCISYGCTDTLLIVAGDCGFGFEWPGYYQQVYQSVAGRLRKANNWVAFIRGNHDDPSFFSEEKIAYKRWRTIADYSVIRACGHSILCIGGAISIDRRQRWEENARRRALRHLQTAVWWPGEAPLFRPEEIDSMPAEIQIDTVVTHSAPSFCQLNAKHALRSWAAMDPALMDDVDAERKTMDQIHKYLTGNGHPVERWIYGHFHQSWSSCIDGIDYSMLNVLEFKDVPSL